MRTFVLDSWPMIHWFDTHGGVTGRIRQFLAHARLGHCRLTMNLVNMGEVFYWLIRHRGLEGANRDLHLLNALPIEWVGTHRSLVLTAARMKAFHAISYADGFALATAKENSARLVTGDSDLKDAALAEGVRVNWMGG